MNRLVTADSVKHAVNSLRDRDITPTYDAIRHALGGGSKRDIQRHLTPILDEINARQGASETPPPEQLKVREISQENADRIYLLLRTSADERIDTIQQAEALKLQRRQNDLAAAQAACREHEAHIADLQSSKTAAEERLEDFRERMLRAEALAAEREKLLSAERKSREQIQARLEHATNAAAELRGQLAILNKQCIPTSQSNPSDNPSSN